MKKKFSQRKSFLQNIYIFRGFHWTFLHQRLASLYVPVKFWQNSEEVLAKLNEKDVSRLDVI
jgi:hypothetical protein